MNLGNFPKGRPRIADEGKTREPVLRLDDVTDISFGRCSLQPKATALGPGGGRQMHEGRQGNWFRPLGCLLPMKPAI